MSVCGTCYLTKSRRGRCACKPPKCPHCGTVYLRTHVCFGTQAKDKSLRKRSTLVDMKLRLYEAQGGLCGICELHVGFHEANLDHIWPRSLGGRTVESNLQMTHPECNQAKGASVDFALARVGPGLGRFDGELTEPATTPVAA